MFSCLQLWFLSLFVYGYKLMDILPCIGSCNQGCQLSRIERESHAWTLFLTLSRQACKISRMNAKHPANHVKSHASRKRKTTFFFFFFLSLFLKVKTDIQFDGRRRKKNCKNIFFFHVLVLHAKQFSKVDSPGVIADVAVTKRLQWLGKIWIIFTRISWQSCFQENSVMQFKPLILEAVQYAQHNLCACYIIDAHVSYSIHMLYMCALLAEISCETTFLISCIVQLKNTMIPSFPCSGWWRFLTAISAISKWRLKRPHLIHSSCSKRDNTLWSSKKNLALMRWGRECGVKEPSHF